ncbi:hypothetical protein [Rathayibacter sp. Leaf248]|uniref:hypothetical protein n=1 Tax=Rathayibacter sp. Leaf248 TaxID=2876555 RepID=UPI001E3E9FAE|nr:hypothetical protein [Rathayibacter sp. Leaf248]
MLVLRLRESVRGLHSDCRESRIVRPDRNRAPLVTCATHSYIERNVSRPRLALELAQHGSLFGEGLGNDLWVHLSATNQKRWERALVAARAGINRGEEPEATAPPVGVQALRQRQVRLSDEQKAKLVAEYLAGGNIRQLAASWGVSREAVRSALRQQHVPVRQVVLTDRQLEDAASLKTRGWSLNQLGSLYGVDPKTMKARLQARARDSEYRQPMSC